MTSKFSATNENFPPEQVKEKLGSLSVAIAKSTDPANKLSLCSSRISTLIGIMEYKCKTWVEPGLSTVLSQTLIAMVEDIRRENYTPERYDPLLDQSYLNLLAFLNAKMAYNIEKKIKYTPKEGLDLLKDYNNVVSCRVRWKEAQDTYMKNKDAWSISNKALADIGDVLETIELKYNLVIMPKNYSYSIDDLDIFKKKGGGE